MPRTLRGIINFCFLGVVLLTCLSEEYNLKRNDNFLDSKINSYLGDVFDIPLSNYQNEQFFGKIKYKFNSDNNSEYKVKSVIFDTGSNFLWVRGDNSKMFACGSIWDCKNKLEESTKENFLYFINYATGRIAIKPRKGLFSLLSFNKNSDNFIQNFNFGESIFEEKNVFEHLPFSGILGLGFTDYSNTNDTFNSNFDSILTYFLKNKILRNNIFTFYLNKNTKENKLIFGEIPEDISNISKNDFNFVDLSDNHKHLWKFEAEGIFINDINICSDNTIYNSPCYLVVDSGTSFYTAPIYIIKKIKDSINFDMECLNYESTPDIRIKIKSSKYSPNYLNNPQFEIIMNKEAFITQSIKEYTLGGNEQYKLKLCDLDFIHSKNEENVVILGLKFLQKYFTIFDFERKIIGFSSVSDEDEYKITSKIEYKEIINRHPVQNHSEIDSLISTWRKVYG